ncbi:hypothetical protein [Mycolicibacterium llatzerense]|uniref:hypothetical protein n=1 Tax=Mycolicibacterium llatzerense TaxID=280871 RepID=UPI0021B5AFC6|nr:hypothetical protein [Mycolicibacterium llatzerense]MCT7369442.1 hypothetical protein [Mycolicibacterium llatzerense]
MTDRTSQLLATIDELVDEQLAAGEPMTGYNYGDPQYPKCPHCGRHWHGLPITSRIAMMYRIGWYDPVYNHDEDTSPILCQGSDFIGPMQDEWRILRPRREVNIRIVVDYQDSWRLRRYRDYMEQLQTILVWPEWRILGNPFDARQWFIPRGAHQSSIVYDEYAQAVSAVEQPLPQIDWTPGPHNWGCELRTRSEQVLWEWGWSLSPDPLQALVNEHWGEFTAPEHQLPQRPGFDFTKYVSDDDPTWRIAPGWRSR